VRRARLDRVRPGAPAVHVQQPVGRVPHVLGTGDLPPGAPRPARSRSFAQRKGGVLLDVRLRRRLVDGTAGLQRRPAVRHRSRLSLRGAAGRGARHPAARDARRQGGDAAPAGSRPDRPQVPGPARGAGDVLRRHPRLDRARLPPLSRAGGGGGGYGRLPAPRDGRAHLSRLPWDEAAPVTRPVHRRRHDDPRGRQHQLRGAAGLPEVGEAASPGTKRRPSDPERDNPGASSSCWGSGWTT
jgi:hypothetical protein